MLKSLIVYRRVSTRLTLAIIGGLVPVMLLLLAVMASDVQAAPLARPLAAITSHAVFVTHTPTTTHEMSVYADGRISDQFQTDIGTDQIPDNNNTSIAVMFDQHDSSPKPVDVGVQSDFAATTLITLYTPTDNNYPAYSEDTLVTYASSVLSYQITQRTLATYTNNCVIMELEILNTGVITTLTGGKLLYMVDINVANFPVDDRGAYDPDRRLVYLKDESHGTGYAMGISLLQGDWRGYGILSDDDLDYPDPMDDARVRNGMISPTNAITDGDNNVVWIVANIPDLAPSEDTLLAFGLCARTSDDGNADTAVDNLIEDFDDQFSLSVSKTAIPGAGSTVVAGEPFTYTIAITSTGTHYVDNIVVTDTVPSNTDLITYSVSQGSIVAIGRLITATVGRLYPASDTVTIDLVVAPTTTVASGTIITNQAFIRGEPVITVTRPITHQIINNPVLTLTKGVDENWTRRIKLTFDNAARAEDLMDFPVLVTLNGGRVDYGQTQDEGQDIRFVDADGTLLAHEIEQWNEGGASYVWVRVPQIDDSSSDDYIWMYYGNPDAPDGQDAEGVWASEYRMVYHLADGTNPPGDIIQDSTAYGFDGTNVDSAHIGGGAIASARNFDGFGDYINLGTDLAALNGVGAATLSAWIRPGSDTSRNDIIALSTGGAPSDRSRASIYRQDDELGIVARSRDNDDDYTVIDTQTGIIQQNTWQYVAAVINYAGDEVVIYIDGISQTLSASASFVDPTTPQTDSAVGALGSEDNHIDFFFDGRIDEARVAAAVRSSDWISAQHQSMTDGLITYGGQENTQAAIGPAAVGAPFTYTIVVTNTGLGAASSVVVTDVVPTDTHYIAGGTYIPALDTVSWTILSILSGADAQVTFVVSTCQPSLLNAYYRAITSTQGISSALGVPLLTVLTPPALDAQFAYSPSTVTMGSPAYFTSTSTTDGGPIVAWGWDFGDGDTGSGQTASHVYASAGIYTVTLTVTDTCGYTDTVTGTVDVYPWVSFSAASYSVGEGDGFATVTVTLSSASAFTATVDYGTSDGTATAGTDYVAASGTLTFTPGVIDQTFTVTISGDLFDEADETITLTLSGATNAVISGTNPVTLTILDDDVEPELSIDDVSVAEGDLGTTDATFTVTLSAASGLTVTVGYDTSDGTATAGSDYAAASGTLTFTPGITTQLVTVTVNGDALDEPDETFAVDLSGAVNATISDGQGQGTILDDDPLPDVSIDDVSVAEGDSGTTNATFTVTLSAASGLTVTVGYDTSDGTAAAGSDYAAASGTLTFTPGITTQLVTVAVNGDTLDEPDETFTVDLSGAVNATIADGQGQGTILDDDAEPVVDFQVGSYTVDEGAGEAVITVTLDAPSGRAVNVQYDIVDGTATAPADYTDTSGILVFTPGVTERTFTVDIVDDGLDEDNETVALDLSSAHNAVIGSNDPATLTITDNDPLPVVDFQAGSYTVGEGSGPAVVMVTLSAMSGRDVTVDYDTIDGTATAPDDYGDTGGTLTFVAGTTVQTFTVSIVDDGLDEGAETVVLDLSGAVNATVGPNDPATLTITDNDPLPEVDFQAGSYTVGESSGPAVVTVTLSAMSGRDVTVDYDTIDGTATAPDDYGDTGGTLTFVAGTTVQTFTVSIVDDGLDEGAETVVLDLSGAVNATVGPNDPATLTILDNDGEPEVSIDDVSVAEGDSGTTNATFTVSLSAPSGQEVTVDYDTSAGTATAGVDYVTASGTVTFTAGATTQTIVVQVNGDVLDEPDETFYVDLSSVVNATISDGQGQGTILDDDAPPTVDFESGSYTVGEGVGAAVITVTLSTPSGRDVAVDYDTIDGTATAPDDYGDTGGTLAFAPGVTVLTFTVTIVDDGLSEGNESLTLDLSNPGNAAIGTNDPAVLTIVDDDMPPELSIDDISVIEGNSGTVGATFTVSLSAPAGVTITVDYGTAAGTAAAGSDYVVQAGVLTFSPGVTTRSITVLVNGDALDEDNETFFVDLANATNATIADGQGQAIILDDDALPVVDFEYVGYSVGEGDGTAVIAVILNAPSGRSVTVDYATVDGSATAPADYVATSGTLVFAPGTVVLTFTVTIVDDAVDEGDELLTLNLFAPSNSSIGANTPATLVIVDDDTGTALQIVKRAVVVNGAPLYVGDEIEYQVVVTNTDSGSQTNVIIGDWVPLNTTYVEGSASCTPGATCGRHSRASAFDTFEISSAANAPRAPDDSGGLIVATIGTLNSGEVLTLTFRVSVNPGVSFIGGNIAATQSDAQSTRLSNSVCPSDGCAVDLGLVIAKMAIDLNGVPLQAGETIEYRVVVTNTSSIYSQANIVIDDPLPENTTLIPGSVACSSVAICGESGGAVDASIDNLDPGGTLTLTFRVAVGGCVSHIGGNIASVRSDQQSEQRTDPVFPPGGGVVIACPLDAYEDDDTMAQAKEVQAGYMPAQAHTFCDDSIDWSFFTARAGEVYTVTTSAWGARADTLLALFDTDGHTLLRVNDDCPGATDHSSCVVWAAPADGHYYVRTTNQGDVTGCQTEYDLWIEHSAEVGLWMYLPLVVRNYAP